MSLNPESVTAAYYEMKKSRCKSSRAAMTRASDLGHPCTAYIAFTRIAGEKAEPPDAKLACIFAEGNTQEQAVKTDLEKLGYRIEQSQRATYWDKYEISAHIDGFLVKESEVPTLIEIKSCSPFAFNRFQTVDDIKNAKQYFYRKWLAQLQIYMLMESVGESWLILKNKATGELKILAVALDLEFAETLIKKAEEVRAGVGLHADYEGCAEWTQGWLKENRLNDPEICLECPFKSICLPDLDAGTGIYFSEDGEMAESLKEHESCEKSASRFKELDDEIKTKAKRVFDGGSKEILCGDFVIKGNRVEPKGKAGYWRVDISRIGAVVET